jgi:hypothetical protein
MAIQSPISSSTYQINILAAIAQTAITQLSPGGKARAFSDIVGAQLGQLELNEFTNLSQTLLPYATSDSLDFIGQIYGVPRLPQQNATVAASDDNIEFYVRTGTFGSINNGQNINIPAGVQITTLAAGGPIWITDAVTLPAGDSSMYVSATPYYAGAGGNAAANTLNACNFTGYADSTYGSLLVTNNFGIVSGQNEESDDDYRYRINLKITGMAGANQAALTFQILQVPGIQNVVFVPLAGTYQVYVYAITTNTSDSLLQNVQQVLDTYSAYPLIGTAIAPDLVGISLDTTVTFVVGASLDDQNTALANATSAAESYIDNLKIGQEFVINAIADAIMSADPNILDIGSPNQPLNDIFIWRARSDGTRYSQYLVSDYTPATGERIVVEPSIPNPINITAAT